MSSRGKKRENKSVVLDIQKHDPLTPIDLTQLGGDYDPCFSKSYDLSTSECKLCGDSELCAFAMSQRLRITRKELEERNHYKDLDLLEDVEGIKKHMRYLKRKNLSRREIVVKCSEKFEVPQKTLRKIYKELK